MEAFDTIKITKRGITLVIRIYPGDSTEPIVLLHGGPGLDDYLAPIAQFLAPTFHVVTYDQRGAGASSHHGSYSIQDHVNDLEMLRQHLGVEHLHLFGHSWGGLLAQLYAKSYPQHVASLVLCSSAAGLGRDAMSENREAMRAIMFRRPWLLPILMVLNIINTFSFGLIFSLINRLQSPVYFYHPGKVSKDDLNILSRGSYWAFMGTMRSMLRAGTGSLKKINLATGIPVLLLRGKHDLFRRPDALLRRRFPSAQEVWFEDSGHFPWLEEPDQFRVALAAFYRKAAPTF